MLVKKKTLAIALLPGDVSVIQTTTQRKSMGALETPRSCMVHWHVNVFIMLKCIQNSSLREKANQRRKRKK
jgi:hypothetical protein